MSGEPTGVHVIPILLGGGTPLFATLDSAIRLERTQALATPLPCTRDSGSCTCAARYVEQMESARVAAIRVFFNLPDDELAAIASVASEVEIPAGQQLAAEGGSGHSLFAIESGTAEVVIAGATIGTLGPGDVVGEMAVFAAPPDAFAPPEVAEGGLRTASVIATSPMRLLAIFKRDVWALDQRAPVAAERLRAVLDERREQNARALETQRPHDEHGAPSGSDQLGDSA